MGHIDQWQMANIHKIWGRLGWLVGSGIGSGSENENKMVLKREEEEEDGVGW